MRTMIVMQLSNKYSYNNIIMTLSLLLSLSVSFVIVRVIVAPKPGIAFDVWQGPRTTY